MTKRLYSKSRPSIEVVAHQSLPQVLSSTPQILDIVGGINALPPVGEAPQYVLEKWAVRLTSAGSRHLIGWSLTDGEAKASSTIVEFHPSEAEVTTQSGRRYRVVGLPGVGVDAEYIWSMWLHRNQEQEVGDVSEEFASAISAFQRLSGKDTSPSPT